MSTLNFYREIPSFSDFSDLTARNYFRSVPNDWWVVIADIRGSTSAIRSGRYKEVNMIGAACITCIVNKLGTYDFPFVFGGDGATVLLPSFELSQVKKELQLLQGLSMGAFGLELRVGVVKLKDLYDRGAELFIGKYQLSPGNFLAQFKGSALTLAEEMIKKNLGGELLSPVEETTPNLDGLSCRISPLKSKNGTVLTLLVRPQNQNMDHSSEVIDGVLKKLYQTLNQNFLSAAPVDLERLKWALVPKTLSAELKFSQIFSLKKMARRILEIIVVNLALRFNFNIGNFSPQKYKAELVINSDFKKFDETLRMVLDCSSEQVKSIKHLLNDLYKSSLIFYGTHESSESLLTCIVQSATAGRHLHFVDGAGGGYAMAALELKMQIQKAYQNKTV
ncbi:MAG: hypothetical protein A4S09_11020 [Proteobacteria bacterium SG_bin7]|nr:MAG: hypothetical protein A4S09_11020 [Proteobacteria bacterium SG_bin7]